MLAYSCIPRMYLGSRQRLSARYSSTNANGMLEYPCQSQCVNGERSASKKEDGPGLD
jgi:hypothetical protein